MGLTFVNRKYICRDCNHSSKAYLVISKQADILSYFPSDSRPLELVETRLYKEVLERDDIGIITKRCAVEYVCDACGSINLEAEKQDNYSNVLNFYGPSEATKWFEGFAKHE